MKPFHFGAGTGDKYMANSTIAWRDNTPVSTAFDDVYYSADDGLAESRYVFLANNNLPQAWHNEQRQFTVLETGFGTGLNFCATALLWAEHAREQQQLHFVSVEKYPLTHAEIAKALGHWPELDEVRIALCQQLPPAVHGWHTLSFPQWRLELSLVYGDINTALPQIAANDIRADTFFLDGFAPAKNPEMWSRQSLNQLAQCAATQATLATFTAVGQVRRDLEHHGFTMRKVQGFGRKRDMLVGRFNGAGNPITKAWYKPNTRAHGARIAVVGAGIAGSISAYKLAQRGLHVDVYEQHDAVATGASGNSQGVLFIKLSSSNGLLAQLNLAGFLYAQRFYQQLLRNGHLPASSAQLNGMVQLLNDHDWQRLRAQYANHHDLVRFVSAAEASELAGTRLMQPAAYFPNSGWLAPPALCSALLDHPNITVHCNTSIDAITTTTSGATLHSEQRHYAADALVLCTAMNTSQLIPKAQLPLKAAPGQITHFAASTEHHKLYRVICHDGYIAPPRDGRVAIGATFRMKHPSLSTTERDHQQNLANYHSALPALPMPQHYAGRVSTRATTSDYLPIVGPVPDTHAFAHTFGALRYNARRDIAHCGNYVPNLYVLTGLGSRGLSYAPLAAELLCQQLLNEPLRLAPNLVEALSPARFTLRALKRGQFNAH